MMEEERKYSVDSVIEETCRLVQSEMKRADFTLGESRVPELIQVLAPLINANVNAHILYYKKLRDEHKVKQVRRRTERCDINENVDTFINSLTEGLKSSLAYINLKYTTDSTEIWKRFELLTEDDAEKERLEALLISKNLSKQDLATILFGLRVRPEFSRHDFGIEPSNNQKEKNSNTESAMDRLIEKYPENFTGEKIIMTSQSPEQQAAAVDKLKTLTAPIVKWIIDNYNPHTEVLVGWDRVDVKHLGMGIPFPYSEK
jgi:hypothetical protein